MRLRIAVTTAAVAAIVGYLAAQSPADPLEAGFRNPPDSAKPRTWWHWTTGNVTQEGITQDLEWMKRVGIAGFQLAYVAAGQGQTVEHKILFGTPECLDAVRHAAADRSSRPGDDHLQLGGWSETGGPWVKPEQAMKKLVWSEITVDGPRSFAEKLPHPPTNNGPVRNYGAPFGPDGRPNPDPRTMAAQRYWPIRRRAMKRA